MVWNSVEDGLGLGLETEEVIYHRLCLVLHHHHQVVLPS